MWLKFSTRRLLSTCTCQLPWFSIANNIFQLNLLFSTRNYSWKGVGNIVGKKVFSTSASFFQVMVPHGILKKFDAEKGGLNSLDNYIISKLIQLLGFHDHMGCTMGCNVITHSMLVGSLQLCTWLVLRIVLQTI